MGTGDRESCWHSSCAADGGIASQSRTHAMTRQLVSTAMEGSVLVIRLCSPENRNSLTMELREQLGNAVELAERDRAVRSVFLTGDGPTFCSGGDLKMFKSSETQPWPVHM